tara:strand:+ start:410 stop:562 length:153 start_codon:yes stop_codon:yes gene_type:complete
LKNKQTPKYILEIVKKYPQILSGRKEYKKYHLRVKETIKLIKKYYSKTSN